MDILFTDYFETKEQEQLLIDDEDKIFLITGKVMHNNELI
jgi:hypothetical protein